MTIASLPSNANTAKKCISNMLYYAVLPPPAGKSESEFRQEIIDNLAAGSLGQKFWQMRYGYAFVKKIIDDFQRDSIIGGYENPKVVMNGTIQTAGQSYYFNATRVSKYSEALVIQACAEARRVEEICKLFASKYDAEQQQTETDTDAALSLIITNMGGIYTLLSNYA